MRFSRSTCLLMFLSLETLTFIIRTGLPILVELVDLVNTVIIFLSQMTLLRLLTFLLESQTVILIVLLFWIYFFCYLFYKFVLFVLLFVLFVLLFGTSICFTMALPPLGNSDYVVVSVSIDFPTNS